MKFATVARDWPIYLALALGLLGILAKSRLEKRFGERRVRKYASILLVLVLSLYAFLIVLSAWRIDH